MTYEFDDKVIKILWFVDIKTSSRVSRGKNLLVSVVFALAVGHSVVRYSELFTKYYRYVHEILGYSNAYQICIFSRCPAFNAPNLIDVKFLRSIGWRFDVVFWATRS